MASPRNSAIGYGWIKDVRSNNVLKVGQQELLESYRITGFETCKYTDFAQCKCEANPFCMWNLGDSLWKQNDKVRQGEIVGLRNSGISCYLNVLLQSWYNYTSFRSSIFTYNSTDPEKSISHLQKIFAKMNASKESVIDTASIFQGLGLDPNVQQDPSEYYTLLLQRFLGDVSTSAQDIQMKMSIERYFQFIHRSFIVCNHCKNTSEFTEITTFGLDLPSCSTLEQSLEKFAQTPLVNDEQPFCKSCDGKRDATEHNEFLALPDVLQLLLGRSTFNRSNRTTKESITVSFPQLLNIAPHAGNSQDSTKSQYVLTGIIEHIGSSVNSGHYIARLMHLSSQKWYKMNDEHVTEFNIRTLTDKGVKSSSHTGFRIKSSVAYCLFYTRLDLLSVSGITEPPLPQQLVQFVAKEDENLNIRRKQVELLFQSKNPSTEMTCDPDLAVNPGRNLEEFAFLSKVWIQNWLNNPEFNEIPQIQNYDILCKHKKLRPPNKDKVATKYKIVPVKMAKMLCEAFHGEFLSGQKALCELCVTNTAKHLVQSRQKPAPKNVASVVSTGWTEANVAKEGEYLKNLNPFKDRPTFSTPGKFYLLPINFILDWQNAIKTHSPNTPIRMNTFDLLCDGINCGCLSPSLIYPFCGDQLNPIFGAEILKHVCIVTKQELDILKENRSLDLELSVRITKAKEDSTKFVYSHNVGICVKNSFKWMQQSLYGHYNDLLHSNSGSPRHTSRLSSVSGCSSPAISEFSPPGSVIDDVSPESSPGDIRSHVSGRSPYKRQSVMTDSLLKSMFIRRLDFDNFPGSSSNNEKSPVTDLSFLSQDENDDQQAEKQEKFLEAFGKYIHDAAENSSETRTSSAFSPTSDVTGGSLTPSRAPLTSPINSSVDEIIGALSAVVLDPEDNSRSIRLSFDSPDHQNSETGFEAATEKSQISGSCSTHVLTNTTEEERVDVDEDVVFIGVSDESHQGPGPCGAVSTEVVKKKRKHSSRLIREIKRLDMPPPLPTRTRGSRFN